MEPLGASLVVSGLLQAPSQLSLFVEAPPTLRVRKTVLERIDHRGTYAAGRILRTLPTGTVFVVIEIAAHVERPVHIAQHTMLLHRTPSTFFVLHALRAGKVLVTLT